MMLRCFSRPALASNRALPVWRAFSSQPTKLPNNPHIFAFPTGGSHLLTLLPTNPPTPSLGLGYTTSIPPSPATFKENPDFLKVLGSVLSEFATSDPLVQSQATVFASQGGTTLGGGAPGGGVTFPPNHPSRRKERTRRSENHTSTPVQATSDEAEAGAASAQGGTGSGGRGGWVHVSDLRNSPEFGRIAWPEDMFGSLEVDNQGKFVSRNGNYQPSGTYRIITNDGILGLTDFLRTKLVNRLRELETQLNSQ